MSKELFRAELTLKFSVAGFADGKLSSEGLNILRTRLHGELEHAAKATCREMGISMSESECIAAVQSLPRMEES